MKSLFLIASLLMAGCVSGEITEPEACDSHTITFQGVPPLNLAFQLPPVMQSFTLPTGVGQDWISNIMLISGSLTRDNNDSFAFLDELMISVVDPNGGPDVIIWDVHAPATDTDALPITATDRNLATCIDKDNNITVNITLSTQQPPVNDWNLNANLCVSASITKTENLTGL